MSLEGLLLLSADNDRDTCGGNFAKRVSSLIRHFHLIGRGVFLILQKYARRLHFHFEGFLKKVSNEKHNHIMPSRHMVSQK